MEKMKPQVSRWTSSIIISILCSLVASSIFNLIVGDKVPFQSFFIIIFILILFWLGHINVFSFKIIAKVFRNETILDWEDVCRGAEYLNDRLRNDGYIPTHILGIGRGGAVMSALISGNLVEKKHIPFSVFERKYSKDETGMRRTDLFDGVSLGKCDLSRALLVAGDVYSGQTAQRFKSLLLKEGAKEIRFAVLTKHRYSGMIPEYFFEIFDKENNLSFPWMLSKNYVRYVKVGEGEEKV